MVKHRENKKNLYILLTAVIAVFWAFFYFGNIFTVPFHPDESTQIFMSSDVELLFNNTTDLIFDNTKSIGVREKYRLLDAPLTKYFIGLSRSVFQEKALIIDWDWSKSWSENLSALPSRSLLIASRVGISIFFPGSIFLIYLISKRFFTNKIIPVIFVVIYFAFNSLLLLHSRRAMAEGILIFFLLLSLYSLLSLPKKWLWLSAIPISFAINSKQSLFFLIPIAILLILINNVSNIKILLFQIILFSCLVLSIYYISNPITWKNPIYVIKLMVSHREELSKNQVDAINSVTPEFITNSFSEKIIAFIGQSFILPPAPQDISNYQSNLENSIQTYFNNPIHRGLLRNLYIGMIIFLITVWGFIRSFLKLPIDLKIIFSFGYLFFIIETLLYLNIPFQRYYLPSIPFMIIFSIFGVDQLLSLLREKFSKKEVQ
jgi:hypothetical protein